MLCLIVPCTCTALQLTDAEIADLGIEVVPALPARYGNVIDGFCVVLNRELVAQPLADLLAARAAARQSRAAQDRTQRLAGTPGADSAAVRDSAVRQFATDDATLGLAEAKVSTVLGERAPWSTARTLQLVRQLGAGRIKFLRVTFPLGSFTAAAPGQLHLSRFDGTTEEARWHLGTLRPAPADAALPGRSYLATVENSDLADGERLLAHAAEGTAPAAQREALIPRSAVVIAGDRYWAYRRLGDGSFVRFPVDINRAQAGGYVVAEGIKPGAAVVVSGAGLLLAYETHPRAARP